METKTSAEKIRWVRNVQITGRHMADIFINPYDHFVVVELFTPFTPRAVVFACVYDRTCDYLQLAMESALQCCKRYDAWCRKGMILDYAE